MKASVSRRRAGDEPVQLGEWLEYDGVASVVPSALLEQALAEPQKAFPAIAKDPAACRRLVRAVRTLKTGHVLHNTDSRQLDLKPESIDLVVTSPPYWTLKRYNEHDAQLGHVEDYDKFLDELDEVWKRCYDALVPGGRLVIVVGDVNVSRRTFGRHMVYPLHASIQERCRLRSVKADVSEMSFTDGLRLAVEVKPVHLAVGRAIWNRFGDIRTFAVNVHLKFPFAVVGGILTLPTSERLRSGDDVEWKSTAHLVSRAVGRFVRAGGRRTEGDAPHLLEAIAVVAFDRETRAIEEDLPPPQSGLRWHEFIATMADVYQSRFGEV